MSAINELREQYDAYKALNLNLAMTRGQPAVENFDLSNDMLTAVTTDDLVTPSGVSIRNYPGGIYGLKEARELFAPVLGVKPEEMLVGNNSSLTLMGDVLSWALLRGLKDSPRPWIQDNPKLIVTTPAYDRHFKLAAGLGYELVGVDMTSEGPNVDQVQALVKDDPSVKGIFFVPVYSNPTGDSISDEMVRRLVNVDAAAPDFTIFADNAYAVHHLTDEQVEPLNLLRAAEEAGRPDRVYLFGSTSKVTFAGAGLGFMASSVDNLAYLAKLLGLASIGPNKIEQYRHVRFLQNYPGGLKGLMAKHAEILAPKFEAVQEVLEEHLGGTDLARWTDPKGGYFVSLDTNRPIAKQVIELAKGVGVALTPAGATFPGGVDNTNTNIRLAPSRPPLDEVIKAMEIVALCIKLASAEYDVA